MNNIKLYTEEQVKDMFGIMHPHHIEVFLEENYTAIELPTEDEIKHKIIKEVFVSWFSNDEYERGFQDGAKWVIEQIKKQNQDD